MSDKPNMAFPCPHDALSNREDCVLCQRDREIATHHEWLTNCAKELQVRNAKLETFVENVKEDFKKRVFSDPGRTSNDIYHHLLEIEPSFQTEMDALLAKQERILKGE